MQWFDRSRVPAGNWPFLQTVRNGLAEIEEDLAPEVDFTEGTGNVLVTGEIQGYRQAVMRRVVDLAQAVAVCWNAGFLAGAAVCSRSLLETVAIFHSFTTKAQARAKESDWRAIGELLTDYVTHSSDKALATSRAGPPRIGSAVKDFIGEIEPGREAFWDQICDVAHPNGRRMVGLYGSVEGHLYRAHLNNESEGSLFVAIYNVVCSCCWLICADLEVDILLEEFRAGGPLAKDHPLIVRREFLDGVTAKAVEECRAPPS